MINLTLNSMNNLMCNSQLLMTFGLRVTLQDYSMFMFQNIGRRLQFSKQIKNNVLPNR